MSFSIFGILAVILEVIRPALPWLLAVLIIWVFAITFLLTQHKGQANKTSVKPSVIVAVAVGVLGLLFVPMITGASHSNLHSIIDYMALIGASVGLGVAAALFLWPFICLFKQAK